MNSPYQLQHYSAHTDRATVVGPSRSVLLQQNGSLLPSIIGSDTESHALRSNSRASWGERFGGVSRFSESISSSPQSFFTASTSPSCSPDLLWHSVKPELQAWSFSTSQQEGLKRTSPFSTSSSPQSFCTASTSISLLSARPATTSPASICSGVSSPYSVTSVNSYKSRKTVLYRRRAHPIPVIVSRLACPEYVVSLEVCLISCLFPLFWINSDSSALRIGPDLGSSTPLYFLVAGYGNPSRTGGNAASRILGPQRCYRPHIYPGERRISVLF